MPIQSFTIQPQNCIAGQQTAFPANGRNINNNAKEVQVRIASSEWASKAGQGVLESWGLIILNGSGQEVFRLHQPDIAYGQVGGKDGLPPAMAISGSVEVQAIADGRVQFFATPSAGSVDIELGGVFSIVT